MTTYQEGTFESAVHLHCAMARLWVHIFCSAFESDFDHICGEILRKDPNIYLESTYMYVGPEVQQ